MRRRFGCCRHARAARMTAVAIGRSALEYGVYVARLASFIAVRAGELESRGQVIEVARGWRGGLCKRERRE